MAAQDPDLTDRFRAVQVDLFGPDGYLPVLALLLASTMCGLLIGDSYLGALATVTLTACALLITVRRSTSHGRIRVGTLAFAVGVVVLTAVSPGLSAHQRAEAGWLALMGYVVIVASALPLVLIRALQHRRVTLNTLCATVSAYLLLGMFFAGLYRLYAVVSPPFFAQDPVAGTCVHGGGADPACPSAGEYTYFSFVTLATVGYGDLTPGTDPARAFVTLEAVTGQVFVITALARVVSLLGEDRPRFVRTEPDPDSAD